MVNYENGKIYKIVNTVNDGVYIGSTTQSLADRMSCHRMHASRRSSGLLYPIMRDIGVAHFTIILIKSFSCADKAELISEEYKEIQKAISSGIRVYNSIINGKHSADTIVKMRQSRIGALNSRFSRGSIGFHNNNWSFTWRTDGKSCSKSFSVKKYGEEEAKRLAIAYQDMIYPINQDPLVFNKEFVEGRVLKKMIQFREEFYPLADRGLIEVRASERLIQYYERMIQVFQKHLDRSVDTDDEQRMQRFMNKALYAQEHAESYRTIIVQ